MILATRLQPVCARCYQFSSAGLFWMMNKIKNSTISAFLLLQSFLTYVVSYPPDPIPVFGDLETWPYYPEHDHALMEPISAHAPLNENASQIPSPLSGFHFEDYNPFGLAEFAADDEWFKLGDARLYFESFPSLPAEATATELKSLDNHHFTHDVNSPCKSTSL
jgi:hypothetical protein